MNHASMSNQTPLALARKKRGWTQAYVAEHVGVSIDAVRRWEGGRLPYPASIQKLCHLFALSPHELGLFRDPDSLSSSSLEAWEAGDAEKQAAWEIYIELVTRISLVTLEEDWGILREALSSLYSLFQTVRTILRQLGPIKSPPDSEPTQSCTYLAIKMLNTVLRPLLSKWHPLLKDYEEQRSATVRVLEHERAWEHYGKLRRDIMSMQKALQEYANAFAQIAGVSPLLIERHREEQDG